MACLYLISWYFIGSKRIFLKKIQEDMSEDTTEKINTEQFTVPSLDKQVVL